MPRINHTTFSRQALEDLPANIDHITIEIEKFREQIKQNEEQLILFQKQLQLQTGRLGPVEATISMLSSRIRIRKIRETLEKYNASVKSLQEQIASLKNNMKAIQQNIERLDNEKNHLTHHLEIIEQESYVARLSEKVNTLQPLLEKQRLELVRMNLASEKKANVLRGTMRECKAVYRAPHYVKRDELRYAKRGESEYQFNLLQLKNEDAFQNEPLIIEYKDILAAITILQDSIAKNEEVSRSLPEAETRLIHLKALISDDSPISDSLMDLKVKLERNRILRSKQPNFTPELMELNERMETLNNGISRLNKEYDQIKPPSGDGDENEHELGVQLAQSQVLYDELKKPVATINTTISEKKQAIEQLKQSILTKEKQLAELTRYKEWRRQIQEVPSELISHVSQAIRNLHAHDENKHFFPTECLDKLNIIMALQTQKTIEATRETYYQICGMLSMMLARINHDNSGPYPTLTAQIESILDQHPLDANESATAYQQLQNEHPVALKQMDALTRKQKEYDIVYQALNDTLKQIPNDAHEAWLNLRLSGYQLIRTIDKQRQEAARQGSAEFALEFYISVLKQLQQLANNPANSQLHEKYSDLATINTTINEKKQAIEQLKQSILTKEKQLAEFIRDKEWRRQIQEVPSELISHVSQAIRNLHAHDENKHFFPTECLDKLNIILALQTQKTIEASRETYYQICGMLSMMLARINHDNSGPYPTLTAQIKSILDQHPVDAKTAYQQLQNKHPVALKQMDALTRKQKEYDIAYQALNDTLKQIPNDAHEAWLNLRLSGYQLIRTIDKQKQAAARPGSAESALEFYISVLKQSQQLANNPANSQLHEKYSDLMQGIKQDVKLNRMKKILGVLLMFIGAVTAVASLSMVIGTFGMALPLACTSFAVGGGSFLTGLGLFSHGNKKGMAESMQGFERNLELARSASNQSLIVVGKVI